VDLQHLQHAFSHLPMFGVLSRRERAKAISYGSISSPRAWPIGFAPCWSYYSGFLQYLLLKDEDSRRAASQGGNPVARLMSFLVVRCLKDPLSPISTL
jgi:hypothetical protein